LKEREEMGELLNRHGKVIENSWWLDYDFKSKVTSPELTALPSLFSLEVAS
jgi:hypothetical protein